MKSKTCIDFTHMNLVIRLFLRVFITLDFGAISSKPRVSVIIFNSDVNYIYG